MREVEINGTIFEVRGLKRKEIKKLRKDGIVLTGLDAEKADIAMDLIFELLFANQIELIDDMENADALKLWVAVMRETYGASDEEKNLQTSGNGIQTESE